MVFSLNDVAPDGTSTQVVQGYLNVPPKASLSNPKPLVPSQLQKAHGNGILIIPATVTELWDNAAGIHRYR
jgi:hypothetical protein